MLGQGGTHRVRILAQGIAGLGHAVEGRRAQLDLTARLEGQGAAPRQCPIVERGLDLAAAEKVLRLEGMAQPLDLGAHEGGGRGGEAPLTHQNLHAIQVQVPRGRRHRTLTGARSAR